MSAVDQNGQNFLGTVVSVIAGVELRRLVVPNALIQEPGDLWYFPPGIPHSLQATNDSADGAEFLLVCHFFE